MSLSPQSPGLGEADDAARSFVGGVREPPAGHVAIPLVRITRRLPETIRPALLAPPPPGASHMLSLEEARRQIESGKVEVSFGSIRRGAPPGVFADTSEFDAMTVCLPLSEIVGALGSLRHGLPSRLALAVEAVAAGGREGDSSGDTTRFLSVLQARLPPVRTAVRSAELVDGNPADALAFSKRSDVTLSGSMERNEDGGLRLPLRAVSASWPLDLLESLSALFAHAEVVIPDHDLKSGLATGRIEAFWGQVRTWLRPVPLLAASDFDAVKVDFPLGVIVPMVQTRLARQSQRPHHLTGETFPDVFAPGAMRLSEGAPIGASTGAPPPPPAPSFASAVPFSPPVPFTPPAGMGIGAGQPKPESDTQFFSGSGRGKAPRAPYSGLDVIPAPPGLASPPPPGPAPAQNAGWTFVSDVPQPAYPPEAPSTLPPFTGRKADFNAPSNPQPQQKGWTPQARQTPAPQPQRRSDPAPASRPSDGGSALAARLGLTPAGTPARPQQRQESQTSRQAWKPNAPAPAPQGAAPILGSDVVMDDFLGPAPRGGWSVRDIVRGASSLPGVGGILLVSTSGEILAKELPGLCSEQALSSFLQQVFESVDACARDIGQEGVDRMSLTMGGMPWRLYKLSQSFLLFMGKPSEHLPMVQLELVAAELSRRV